MEQKENKSEYWSDQLSEAIKEREDYYECIKEARALRSGRIEAYSKHMDEDRKLNVWANMVSTLLSAYMNRIPEVNCKIKNNDDDLQNLVTAKLIEDVVNYELKEKNDLFRELEHYKKSYIIDGMAILWARYDYKKIEEEEELATIAEDGTVQTITETYDFIYDENIKIESLMVEDFLTNTARVHREIEWVAKRSFLTKDQIIERFEDADQDILDEVEFGYGKAISLRDDDFSNYSEEGEKTIGDKAAIWEVWCDKTKTIYYLIEVSENSFEIISKADNPLADRSKHKFPCSFIVSNQNVDTIIPIPDYQLIKDLVIEVESLENRIFNCVLAIRLNILVNSEYEAEITELFTHDFKIIPIKNASLIEGKSALRDSFYNYDISPFVNALPVLLNSQERAIKKIEELLGINDVLKGNMDARATATTANYENAYTGLRFENRKKEISNCLTEIYSIVADMIFINFEDSTIKENFNLKHIVKKVYPSLLQGDPNNIVMILQALEEEMLSLARKDLSKRFKLEVQTDSLSSFDEEAFKQDRMNLIDMGVNALRSLGELASQTPSAIDAIKTLFIFALRSHKGHKETEGQLLAIFEAMKAESSQQKGSESQPNIEVQVANIEHQIAQLNSQTKLAQVEAEKYRANMELEKEKLESEVKVLQSQVRIQELELESQRMVTSRDVKSADLINSREQRESDLLKEEIDTVQEIIRSEAKKTDESKI